jgi:hypothetical protein
MRASPRGAIRNQVSVISSRQLSPHGRNPPIRMMGFALVAPRKSPRSRLNSAYAPAPSKAVRGPLGVKNRTAIRSAHVSFHQLRT